MHLELRHKSQQAWLNRNFGLVAAEPSFLAVPTAEVVELMELKEREGKEESVFECVVKWVKADEVGRKADLDRLLPLVRFPLMAGMCRQLSWWSRWCQHPLAIQLMYEMTPIFVKSGKENGRPRQAAVVATTWWWPTGSGGTQPRAAGPSRSRAPAGAAPGVVRAAPNETDGDGDLPIHGAVHDAATGPGLVHAMLDAGGEAILGVPGEYNMLPLHIAAAN